MNEPLTGVTGVPLIDRLDMKLGISMDPGTEFSEMSRKFSISGEVGFGFSRETPEVILVFPNSAEQHRDLWMFLQKFDAVEHGGVWRIRRQIVKAQKQLEYIRSILEIPSMVLVSAWLSGGKYHAELIFNRNDLAEVSRILLEALQDAVALEIDYLGPSPGFREILSSVDSRTKLSVFEIGLKPPAEETKPENNPLGNRWTRIANIPFGAENISAVYFVDNIPLGMNGITALSDGKIYYAVTGNPYVNYMNRKMNNARILALAMIHEFNSPDFTISLILPKLMSAEYASVVSESVSEMPEWKPVLRKMIGLKEWIGESSGK